MKQHARPALEHHGQGRRWSAFRKRNWPAIAVALFTACLYAGFLCAGLRIKNLSFDRPSSSNQFPTAWTAPSERSLAFNAQGASIRRGKLLFDETPLYAPQFVQARISCSSCHAAAGIQPFAAPMVGLTRLFPLYKQRVGRVITLEDRIQECFVRSENGRPLDPNGQPMQDLVHYIAWLSAPQPNHRAFQGRGFAPMPSLTPDAKRGQSIYAFQCAGCHGTEGQGKPYVFAPLWGPQSYNDGAGMNDLTNLARFVHHNMPQNRMGTLSTQDAWDVSAFIHAQPRPALNPANAHF